MGIKGKPSNQKEQEQRPFKSYAKYTGLAIQMAAAIYLGNLLGNYIDERTGNTTELYTKIITLVAVFLSIVMVIRQVIKSN